MSKHVVVAYDFSETADVALDRAVDLACRAPDHVLHFIAAIDPHRGFGGEAVDYHYAERVQDDLLERLRAIFAARAPKEEIHFFVHARIGTAAEEILDLAKEVGADMIIVGSHGRTGVRRVLLGSVSEQIVRGAKCAVIIARKKEYPDVELPKVVDVAGDHHRRIIPHRYSYTSSAIQTRPSEWPLN